MPEHELVNRVAEGLRPYLPPEVPLIVGVSGGPDSLALLHLLKQVVAGERLVVAHLNHGLRPEAEAEMGFVVGTAVNWGLPVVVDKVDMARLAQANGWSVEEAARNARYQFLAEVAEQENTRFVAVAHHADDQAETVLMHLIRGSGLAGLRGMQPAAPLPGKPEMMLLRPFLNIPRSEIEAYCATNHLQPVYDQSNTDTTFLRNRIRHELLPLLAQYNPQIKTHLQQLASVTAADYALLEEWFNVFWKSVYVEEGEGWIALARARWLELPLSHRRLALRRAILALRPSLTDIAFRPLELARELVERGLTGAQMDLPGGLTLQLEYQRLLITREEAILPTPFVPQLTSNTPLKLAIPGQVALGEGWLLLADVFRGETAVIQQNQNPWVAYVDVGDAVELQVRPRLPGEQFQPLGMHGRHAKVKDVMVNRKIGQGLRPYWPIVATADHLVWLPGHHQDERSRVTPASHRIIRLTCRKAIPSPQPSPTEGSSGGV
jgi:tRNA(Ile)-lysidine synthase